MGGFGTGEGLAIRYNNSGDSFIESFINQTDFPNSGIFFQTNAGGGITGVDPDPTRDVMAIKSNGRVGIGTTNPFEELVVMGDLEISRSATDVNRGLVIRTGGYGDGIATGSALGWLLRGNDSVLPFSSNPPNSLSFEYWGASTAIPLVLRSNGNVGIGTIDPSVNLDVNGGVRAGSEVSVTACGLGKAAGEGTQRYNYTTHRMEYCNGSGWVGTFGTFGGFYVMNPGPVCATPNSETGACTCPGGMTAQYLGHFCETVPSMPTGCYLFYCR